MNRGSLFDVLRKGGNQPLEPRLQRVVAMGVARGMAYLHTRTPPLLHLVRGLARKNTGPLRACALLMKQQALLAYVCFGVSGNTLFYAMTA